MANIQSWRNHCKLLCARSDFSTNSLKLQNQSSSAQMAWHWHRLSSNAMNITNSVMSVLQNSISFYSACLPSELEFYSIELSIPKRFLIHANTNCHLLCHDARSRFGQSVVTILCRSITRMQIPYGTILPGIILMFC